jgi:Ca2+-transporting ATPase
VRELSLAAALCNDAELLPPEDERAGWSVLGEPTEGACWRWRAMAASPLTPCGARPARGRTAVHSDSKPMARATAWPARRAAF